MAGFTAGIFRWYLDYFRSPGPQFHRMVLLFVPALALVAWLYAAIRRAALWKWEPYALAILIAGACLAYEPRATVVILAVFFACSAVGSFAFRWLEHEDGRAAGANHGRFGAGAGMLKFVVVRRGDARLFYLPVFLGLILLPLVILRGVFRTLSDFRELLEEWQRMQAVRHPLAGVAMVFEFVAAACALMLALAPISRSIRWPFTCHRQSFTRSTTPCVTRDGNRLLVLSTGLRDALDAGLCSGRAARRADDVGPFFPLFLMILARLARACGLDQGAVLALVAPHAAVPQLVRQRNEERSGARIFELLALNSFVRWLHDRNFRWILVAAFFLSQAFP